MFGFLKNGKIKKSEDEKRAEQLGRTKKVQFTDMPLNEAEKCLEQDIKSVLTFEPVNYYAVKNSFLLCVIYYDEDYGEIYMKFERRVNDMPHGSTKFYKIDKDLFRSILRKFGQNI